MIEGNHDRPILFFDGECNLCNGMVQFIIRHDEKKIFRFAALQSKAGQATQEYFLRSQGSVPDSIILLYKGKYLVRSAAVLKTCKLLGGPWHWVYLAVIIPRFIRDAVYNLIASKRHKWFGQPSECMIPTPELSERFISK